MKAWLKGGLWGVIASIILGLLSFVISALGVFSVFMIMIYSSSNFIFGRILNCYLASGGWIDTYSCSTFGNVIIISFALILYLISFFLLGALIGWIVGKVKAKRE